MPLRGRAHEASGLRERNELFEPFPYASRVLDWKMHTMDRGPRSRPPSSTATPASMHQPLCGPGITPARGTEHFPATRRFLKARRAQPKHTPVEIQRTLRVRTSENGDGLAKAQLGNAPPWLTQDGIFFGPRGPREAEVLICATVKNFPDRHEVCLGTGESTQMLTVPPKRSGKGSAVNGGEFLMLALATCYCNDLYREAERLHLQVEGMVVKASADFPGIGLAATNIQYEVEVSSRATPQEIAILLQCTDAVAEVHNTLREGASVVLRNAAAP